MEISEQSFLRKSVFFVRYGRTDLSVRRSCPARCP